MAQWFKASHAPGPVHGLAVQAAGWWKGSSVVQYRSFRNDDPPGLVEIWNEAFTGRGSVQLRHSSPLERHAFCKPYFDPAGLIVAVENSKRIGFVHAGFGANPGANRLNFCSGVTCMLGVRPSHQRRGVGSELLSRSEAYLLERGARNLYAGQKYPLNPFYFGLYGGSDLPGILVSDVRAGPFLERHGYRIEDTQLVFQRALDQPLSIVDGRFPAVRRRYEVKALPRAGTLTWWQEGVLGPIEMLEFRLTETATGDSVARAEVWEMEGFSWRWSLPAVGLVELIVREDMRRQGLGKFLGASILRYLQDQYFGLVEVHTAQADDAAVKLFAGLGFKQVDSGRVYRKVPS
jgi:ribosomal protein S18 acetylase RimI-like enzyme